MDFKKMKINTKLITCAIGFTLITTGCVLDMNIEGVCPSVVENVVNKRNKRPMVVESLGITEEYLSNEKSELLINEFASAYGSYDLDEDIKLFDDGDVRVIELGRYSYDSLVFSLKFDNNKNSDDYNLSYLFAPIAEEFSISSHLRELSLEDDQVFVHSNIRYKEKDSVIVYSDVTESYVSSNADKPVNCTIVIAGDNGRQVVVVKNDNSYSIKSTGDDVSYKLGFVEFYGIRELAMSENENILKEAIYLYDFTKEKILGNRNQNNSYYEVLKFFSDLLNSFEYNNIESDSFEKKLR